MAEKVNRWKFVYAALVMQLCLGVLYSWSVFRPVLEKANGWNGTVCIAPFRYSLLFFTVAMIIAGFWQDKKGPKLVGSVGGASAGRRLLPLGRHVAEPDGAEFRLRHHRAASASDSPTSPRSPPA